MVQTKLKASEGRYPFRNFLAIATAIVLFACDQAQSELGICYSEFSQSVSPEFRNSFSEAMFELHDSVSSAYLSNEGVLSIPIAVGGSLYVASGCKYLVTLTNELDHGIDFKRISETEYELQVELASENNRFVPLEKH